MPKGTEFTPFRGDDPLMAFIGDIGMHRDQGQVTLKVTIREGAINRLDMLHGGALGTLFDVAMYELARENGEAVTVTQEVKFLKPVSAQALLFIEAELLRAGRRAVFCTARATQDDTLCAFSTAQFARF